MSFGCVCGQFRVGPPTHTDRERESRKSAWPLYSSAINTRRRENDDASFDVIHHYCFGALALKGGSAPLAKLLWLMSLDVTYIANALANPA